MSLNRPFQHVSQAPKLPSVFCVGFFAGLDAIGNVVKMLGNGDFPAVNGKFCHAEKALIAGGS